MKRFSLAIFALGLLPLMFLTACGEEAGEETAPFEEEEAAPFEEEEAVPYEEEEEEAD